jgi:hypothetical protein
MEHGKGKKGRIHTHTSKFSAALVPTPVHTVDNKFIHAQIQWISAKRSDKQMARNAATSLVDMSLGAASIE